MLPALLLRLLWSPLALLLLLPSLLPLPLALLPVLLLLLLVRPLLLLLLLLHRLLLLQLLLLLRLLMPLLLLLLLLPRTTTHLSHYQPPHTQYLRALLTKHECHYRATDTPYIFCVVSHAYASLLPTTKFTHLPVTLGICPTNPLATLHTHPLGPPAKRPSQSLLAPLLALHTPFELSTHRIATLSLSYPHQTPHHATQDTGLLPHRSIYPRSKILTNTP
jgi:hypothetical protein